MKVKLIKRIDKLIGAALVKILPAPKTSLVTSLGSILFIRPGGIGDAALLIPAIKLFKKNFPRATITVLAEKRNAGIFRLAPDVDRVLLYDRPIELLQAIRGRFDVVIDTEQWHRLSAVVARLTRAPVSIGYATNEREKLFTHAIPYFQDDYEVDSFYHLLQPLRIDKSSESYDSFLEIPKDADWTASALLGEYQDRKMVVLFPGASIPERCWGADRFAKVAKKLCQNGNSIVVVGGKKDVSDCEKIVSEVKGINSAGKTSLTETAAIIGRASVLVSGDSGILHIGVGLDIPTVSLFGPGISKKWAPRSNKHIVINKNLPCSPCTKFGYTPHCPMNGKCMSVITVDEVVDAVERLLVH